MTFRRQLLLSIGLLVLVPALIAAFAIGRVVTSNENAKADARLDAAVRIGGVIAGSFETRAARRAGTLQRDRRLRAALATGRVEPLRDALAELVAADEVEGASAQVPGSRAVIVGAPEAIGVTRVQAPFGDDGTVLLTFAIEQPDTLIGEVERNTGVPIELVGPGGTVTAQAAEFPDRSVIDVRRAPPLTEDRWRVQELAIGGLAGQTYRAVFALQPTAAASTMGPRLIAVALFGFLVVGVTLGVVLMRSLRGRISALAEAADRLGGGDFSAAAAIDVEGGDEFAHLGRSFIGMARQVDQRLDQLERERGRVQNSLLRLGKAFGSTFDRERLVELLVDSAVDGLTADSGRALLPPRTGAPPQQGYGAGQVLEAWDVLQEVEQRVIATGRGAAAERGGIHALAEPLPLQREGSEIGVISVARRRPFESEERDLLTYLTEQASVSLRNIGRHEDVSRESITDELTGLANRRRFDDVLSQAAARATEREPVGLVMIDLDRFKVLNDTHGHLVGDRVLQAVAEVVRASVRERDLAARYGGEELAVVLAVGDADGAHEFAERLREGIAALTLGDEETGPIRVTASFGVASLPGDGDDVNDLVRAADEALYRAKRGGRNRVEQAGPRERPPGEVR